MDQINTLFVRLENALGLKAPYLKAAFKVSLVLLAFLLAWLILRLVLSFIEKRMTKINLIEIQGPLFKIMRKALGYALVLLTGTYLIRLWNIALLEKIFICRTGQEFPGGDHSISAVTSSPQNRKPGR